MYVSIRITLDPSNNRTQTSVYQLLRALIIHLEDKQTLHVYTCGLEQLNKYGEPVDEHYHFNFVCDFTDLKDPKRTLRNFLQKKAESMDFRLVGTRAWCLQMCDEPSDEDRWLRYPLKENPVRSLCTSPPSDPSDCCSLDESWLNQNIILAKSERIRTIETNCLHREKLRDKTTLKEKLFKFLDELIEDPQPLIHKDWWIIILRWYEQNGKPLNFQTISGYAYLYMIHIGSLSPADAYDLLPKQSN